MAILNQNLIISIFPTEADVALVPTEGSFGSEKNMTLTNRENGSTGIIANYDGDSFNVIDSGLKIGKGDSGGLSFNITTGRAIVAGYYIELSGGTVINRSARDLPFVVTNYSYSMIFLRVRSGEENSILINGERVIVEIIAIPFNAFNETQNIIQTPLNSIALAAVKVTNGAITEITDMRFASSSSEIICNSNIRSLYHRFNTVPVSIFYGFFQNPMWNGFTQLNFLFKINREILSLGDMNPAQQFTGTILIRGSIGKKEIKSEGKWISYSKVVLLTEGYVLLQFEFHNGEVSPWDKVGCSSFSLSIFNGTYTGTDTGQVVQLISVVGAIAKNYKS